MYHPYLYSVSSVASSSVEDRTFWVNVVLSVITLLAVLVAIFQEWLKRRWRRSSLDMIITMRPPDCHQIELIDARTHAPAGKSIYIRIKIIHQKGPSAEGVEVMISDFKKINVSGQKTSIPSFLPMNLIWSHFQPRTHIVKIPPNIFRHCDLGHFFKVQDDGCLFILDTIVQPNPVANGMIPGLIQRGRYEFTLLLTGDNVTPLKKSWILEFDGSWSEDEDEMLKKIKIYPIDESVT